MEEELFPEKLTDSQLIKKLPAYYETRKFITNSTRTHSFFRIVSQCIPFRALALHYVWPVLLVSDLRLGHRMITDCWIGWKIWVVGVLSLRCCVIKRGLRKPMNNVRTLFYVWSENRVLVQHVEQTTTLRCSLRGIWDGDFFMVRNVTERIFVDHNMLV